jgi:hypothetical protein
VVENLKNKENHSSEQSVFGPRFRAVNSVYYSGVLTFGGTEMEELRQNKGLYSLIQKLFGSKQMLQCSLCSHEKHSQHKPEFNAGGNNVS